MQQDRIGGEQESGRGINYRALGQIVRGLLFVFVGLLILYAERIGISFNAPLVVKYIFGVVAIIYGAFRVVQGLRGVMKK